MILVKNVPDKKDVILTKPILKWVGGKTQILDKIINDYPTIMENYHEIFLGGGSVLLCLLSYIKNGIIKVNGVIRAYDYNEPLIYVYKNIQNNHMALYHRLQEMIIEFNGCDGNGVNRNPENIDDAKKSKENYYYWSRKQYNKMSSEEKKSINGSALFVFLNKTCFRGVFREGPNGFNVPFGHYTNPEIINEGHIKEVHELIKDVIFEWCDFSVSFGNVLVGDFVYMDPPYVPEKYTSFVGYTKLGFALKQHNLLFKMCNDMTKNNKKFMMSNADVQMIKDNFIGDKYTITSIMCKRSINSKKPESKTNEVIIKNY